MTRYATMDQLRRATAQGDVQIVTDEDAYTTVQPRQGIRRITLDYPPSTNRYWRVYNNTVVRSAEATEYVQHVAQICTTAGIQPLDGNVSVTIRVYRPRRSGDLDNRLKCCLDALQGYAYHNDSQVFEIHATRHDDPQCPRVEVTVTEVNDEL